MKLQIVIKDMPVRSPDEGQLLARHSETQHQSGEAIFTCIRLKNRNEY
jgi:hypothetical protein